MRKSFAFLGVFFLVAARLGVAQDDSEDSGLPTVSEAVVASKAPAEGSGAPVVKEKPAFALKDPAPVTTEAPKVSWYGMAQFRFRGELLANQRSTDSLSREYILSRAPTWWDSIEGINERSINLSQILAYKFGAKINLNKETTLHFEIGNDFGATELISVIPTGKKTRRIANPWFSLAFAQWNPGYLHISAGVIPVKETALMGLLGVSILNNKSYANASQIQWGVVTNFSQPGFKIGAPVLKGDCKLDIDLMSTIIEHRTVHPGFDSMTYNAPAVEYLFETPFSCAGLSATPQLFVIPNRSHNYITGRGDLEVGVGIDLGLELNESITLRGGAGYAENGNKNSFYSGDSIWVDDLDRSKGKEADTLYKMTGVIGSLGATIRIGGGKLDVDVSASTNNNTKVVPMNFNGVYAFGDIKYSWSMNQNYVIMPRLRLYPSTSQSVYVNRFMMRPELCFICSF